MLPSVKFRLLATHKSFQIIKIILFLGIFVCLFLPTQLLAQGFMVKPSIINISAAPGETVEKLIEIRNTLPKQKIAINIDKWNLGQQENGVLSLVAPDGELTAQQQRYTCLPWVEVDENLLVIAPMETKKLTLRLKIPKRKSGFYAAALTAQSGAGNKVDSRGQKQNIAVDVYIRFLIPVYLNVKGPTLRTKVELSDTQLEFKKENRAKRTPASTIINAFIENKGSNRPYVTGHGVLLRQSGNHWARVSKFDFRGNGILPGSKIKLSTNLNKALPSGRYRLDLNIKVDGRRLKPLKKEIDFSGDPNVKDFKVDTSVQLSPNPLEISGTPRANRSKALTVLNPSEETLLVNGLASTPPSLIRVAMGESLGEHFNASSWVTIRPQKFRLAGGKKRKVRVTVAYPKDHIDKPSYFADLKFNAAYQDGQKAGESKALLLVRNKNAASTPLLKNTAVDITEIGKEEYSIQARYGNFGDKELDPTCKGVVNDATGLSTIKSFKMERDTGLILPLGTLTFSGLINIKGIKPGAYSIKLITKYLEKKEIKSINFTIEETAGKKQLQVLEPSPTGS